MGPYTRTDQSELSDAVTFRYDIAPDEQPSLALVTVLAGITGSDPTEMEPVDRYVDLEALDEFLAPARGSSPWTTSVRLAFGEHAITIDGSEIVVDSRQRDAGDRTF